MLEADATFRTVVPLRSIDRPIEIGQTLLSLGSCFAQEMGERLRRCHFDISLNPTGILFNPASICAALRRIVAGAPYEAGDLFLHQGLWRSFDHHGDFAAPDRDVTLAVMNQALAAAREALQRMDWLIITLGTAFGYFHRETGAIVANCHRMPPDTFNRRLLDIDEIAAGLGDTIEALRVLRPELGVMLTVSPVRHLRDQPHENSVSKAHLMAAVHRLEKRFADICYFPAYELILDDLRDYRFYGPDMAHPNELAMEYVWSAFVRVCLSQRSRRLVERLQPLLQAMEHEVQLPGSEMARAFAARQLSAIDEIEQEFPEVRLVSERKQFSALMEP